MERSESIIELSKALVKFHSGIGKIKKGANNPFYKSKYAPLDEIISITKKPLADVGLVVTQLLIGDCGIITMLMHESGEYILSKTSMMPVDNKPQTIGSCITYMRRYAYQSILSLSIGDKDDDGNLASGVNKNDQKNEQVKKKLTPSQINSQAFYDWLIDNKNNAIIPENFDSVTFVSQHYEVDDDCKELIKILVGEK